MGAVKIVIIRNPSTKKMVARVIIRLMLILQEIEDVGTMHNIVAYLNMSWNS